MKRILTLLGVIAVGSLSIFSASLLSTSHPEPVAGAANTTNLIGGFPYFLAGSGISSSASSITVTSFTLPQTGYKILTADVSSPFYITLEAGSTSRQEFASCTTVTQNANNTATFTGCVRGLLPISPYSSNSNYAFSHSGGTTLIFSNSPSFYQSFLALGNVATSTNILIFSSTTPPRYDFPAAQASGTYIATTSELASVAYVNAVTTSGAPNASTAVKGIVQLATALQQASSTALGSTAASLVTSAVNATDTPQRGCSVGFTGVAGASCSVIADLTGHIKQAWLDLTASWTFSTTTQYIANIGTLTATTSASINNLTVTGSFTASTTWTQLVSTTTSVSMAYATTSSFTGYNNLRVVVYSPGITKDAACFTFNSDNATNYGYTQVKDGTFFSKQSLSNAFFFGGGGATTTDMTMTLDINNPASKRKQGSFNLQFTDSSSDAPIDWSGSFVWNNAVSQITQLVLGSAGTCNLNTPAGTTIRVYGTN